MAALRPDAPQPRPAYVPPHAPPARSDAHEPDHPSGDESYGDLTEADKQLIDFLVRKAIDACLKR